MTVLATPTPYLRDGLRRLVAGLKRDAETVRLNLAVAEQDVAAARALLAEAEAHRDRAQAEADGIAKEIAFFEREAAERTPPAYDPDAALAATGLMPREDEPQHTGGNGRVVPPPGEVEIVAPTCVFCGEPLMPHGDAWLHCHGVRDHPAAPDDLVPPGAPVKDSRAEVAPHLPPPVPHGPDAGTLAALENGHPLTTRTDPVPGPRGQHAAPPRTSRVTGALRKVGLIHDEQDGDQTDG